MATVNTRFKRFSANYVGMNAPVVIAGNEVLLEIMQDRKCTPHLPEYAEKFGKLYIYQIDSTYELADGNAFYHIEGNALKILAENTLTQQNGEKFSLYTVEKKQLVMSNFVWIDIYEYLWYSNYSNIEICESEYEKIQKVHNFLIAKRAVAC